MFRIATDRLLPGMVTARNIYNANGSLLLAENVTLDPHFIFRLLKIGIDSIYVRHPFLDVEPQEILHERTRVETIKLTQQAFVNFSKTQTIKVAGISEIIKKVIEDAVANRNALIHLTDIRTHDDYTFGHSINVCLLSVMIGLKMGLSQRQLFDLALGAILHDLGKMLVPSDILNKPGKLSADEWRIMQEHTDKGFAILRKNGALSAVTAHVAFQHHENFDGSGYPRGLGGTDIHQYAKIAAIADIYDAITSDRPYRKAMLPHEAFEIVAAFTGTKLDPRITTTFLDNVALYPVGSTVLLDTGETGVVVKVYPKIQTRPIIRIIADSNGQAVPGPEKVIDLTRELTRFIVKVFKPEEVFAIGQTTLA